MTNTRTFIDNSHSFTRRKRRITNDGHSGLVSIIGSSCSALYCSCCSALCSEYCRSTTYTSPWTSRLIFFHRAPFSFQVGVSGVHAGVWGCSERKNCLQQADGPL
jgi:hypothetical protein